MIDPVNSTDTTDGRRTVRRLMRYASVSGAGVLLLVGAFLLGRHTATDRGYDAGYANGEIAGVREGRLLQGTVGLGGTAGLAVSNAYQRGYTDGANDAFTLGFDGGWQIGVPYVVVLAHGPDGITYRFASREPVRPGITYRLCGSSQVCASR